MKSTRDEVYAAIDGERDYQKKWGEHSHEVATFLTYIREYLRRAELLAATIEGGRVAPYGHEFAGENALDMVRKITALGVACMEQNGAQPRRP